MASSSYFGFTKDRLAPGIDLFTKQDNSFKTVTIKAYMLTDLGEDSTRVALLPFVLRRGTTRFPALIELSRELEKLYGSHLSVDTGKFVEWQTVNFHLNLVSDRFIPGKKSVLEPGIRMLGELINDPVISDNGFNTDYIEQEKRGLRIHIESLINDKSQYAVEQMLTSMCRNEAFRHFEYGRIEDLPSIDPKNQYEFYQQFMAKSPMAIFAFGSANMKKIKSLIKEQVLPAGRKRRLIRKAPEPILPKRKRNISEKLKLSLSHLVMGFRTGYRFGGSDAQAYSLYASMLGGHMMSRLFMTVREQASLAYSIYASASLKGLLIIYAGVEAKNRVKAEKMILKEMKSFERGQFSQQEFDYALKYLQASYRAIPDSPSRRINGAFVQAMTKRPRSEEKAMAELDKVTPQDIVRVAKTVRPDTFYFLGGK